jgi:hypothetical protein
MQNYSMILKKNKERINLLYYDTNIQDSFILSLL